MKVDITIKDLSPSEAAAILSPLTAEFTVQTHETEVPLGGNFEEPNVPTVPVTETPVTPLGGNFEEPLPQPVVPVTTAATPSTGVELDKDGVPWDERIHSSSRKQTAKGVWAKRRGVDAELYKSVTAELKAGSGPEPVTPQPTASEMAPPQPAAAPVAPQPAAAPEPVAPQPAAAPVTPAPAPQAETGNLEQDRQNLLMAIMTFNAQRGDGGSLIAELMRRIGIVDGNGAGNCNLIMQQSAEMVTYVANVLNELKKVPAEQAQATLDTVCPSQG